MKEKTKKINSNLTSHFAHHTSDHRGITLIALIITIIVMLILVAVTLNVALQGGLISKTQEAKAKTEEAQIQERDLLTGRIKIDDTWYDSIEKYLVGEKSLNQKDVQEDEPPTGTTIPITENCEGYYADLDGDPEPDGIIYADLAIGSGGSQNWGTNGLGVYEYNQETTDLKDYIKETEEAESAKFGNYKAPMIKLSEENSGTKPRFYVMALEDVDGSTHTWYKSASGKLDNTISSGDNDFEQGIVNTEYVYKPEVAASYRNFE